MARLRKHLFLIRKSSHGFSLTEVLIAIVILGLVGATIINSITTDTKVRGKTNNATNVSVNLAAAGDVLISSNIGFNSICSSALINTYQNAISAIPDVKVTSIEGLRQVTNSNFEVCDVNGFQSAVQRITLKSTTPGIERSRTILKTIGTPEGTFSNAFNITSNKKQVNLAAISEASCGASSIITLSNSLASNSVRYEVADSGDTSKVGVVKLSNNQFLINGISPVSSMLIAFQGFSINESIISSNVISVSVRVFEPISFSTRELSYRSVESKQRLIELTSTDLFLSGGSGQARLVGLTSNSNSFAVSGSPIRFRYLGTSYPLPLGSYDSFIKISDPGLDNAIECQNTSASSTWKVKLDIVPPLTFTSYSDSTCIPGTSSNCRIIITPNPATGSTGRASLSTSNGGYDALSSNTSSPLTYIYNLKQVVCLDLTSTTTPVAIDVNGSSLNSLPPYVLLSNNFYSSLYRYVSTINLRNMDDSFVNGARVNLDSTSTTKTKINLEIDSMNTKPTTIRAISFNAFYPTLSDDNFGNSYNVTSSTGVPVSCI